MAEALYVQLPGDDADDHLPEEADKLEGARAIADFLGWDETKRVYRLVERRTAWPIWREPGIGIMAFKSGLRAYLRRRHDEAVARGRARR